MCTAWLKDLDVGAAIKVYLRASTDFAPPTSLERPLLMIGPGTGVAPFIGFISHRARVQMERKREEKDGCPSDGVWRCGLDLEELSLEEDGSSESDSVSSSEMFSARHGVQARVQGYLFERSLLAWSRVGRFPAHVRLFRDQAHKVYVQHKLFEEGALVADLILSRGAYVFVCGDGAKMASDVHAALADILRIHGKMSTDEAMRMLRTMSTRGMYVRDIWS